MSTFKKSLGIVRRGLTTRVPQSRAYLVESPRAIVVIVLLIFFVVILLIIVVGLVRVVTHAGIAADVDFFNLLFFVVFLVIVVVVIAVPSGPVSPLVTRCWLVVSVISGVIST